jgi:TonB family protein
MRFRPLGRGTFVGGILMTVAIHVALACLVYFSHVRSTAGPPSARDVVVTRMVHLGKPRDPFYLPRIVQPPRPKAPAPTIKVTDDLNAAPARKDPPRPPDPEPSKELKRALDRARTLARNAVEEPPEGSLLGSESGTSTQASEGDPYATLVHEAILKNWSVPAGLSIGDVITFETEVNVVIAADGRILEPALRKSSGNALYDASCLQAVEATRRVAPPPPRYRKGLVVVFDGKELAR